MPQPQTKRIHLEVALPAMLPLGIVKQSESGRPRIAHLGITLQHPPVQIFAQIAPQITVTGPRADIGASYIERFVATSPSVTKAEIQIETAIPAYMGLGSEPMLGIGMVITLKWFNQQPYEDGVALANSLALDPLYNLEQWGANGGGLLLVDTTPPTTEGSPLLWRTELKHADKDAWGFVLVMPRVPVDIDSMMEADRRTTMLEAAQTMTTESGELFESVIRPAVEQDDIVAFGRGLMTLQRLNQRALADLGRLPQPTAQNRAVLRMMQERGAVAWGQSPDGFCCYALTKGARATIDMRAALRKIVGPADGHMLATITDNRGAYLIEKPGALPIQHEMRPT